MNRSSWSEETVLSRASADIRPSENQSAFLVLHEFFLPRRGSRFAGVERQRTGFGTKRWRHCQLVLACSWMTARIAIPISVRLFFPQRRLIGAPRSQMSPSNGIWRPICCKACESESCRARPAVVGPAYSTNAAFLDHLESRRRPYIARLPNDPSAWPVMPDLLRRLGPAAPKDQSPLCRARKLRDWIEGLASRSDWHPCTRQESSRFGGHQWHALSLNLGTASPYSGSPLRVRDRWLIFLGNPYDLFPEHNWTIFLSNLSARVAPVGSILTGLRYRSTSPCDFASIQFSIDLPLPGTVDRGASSHIALFLLAASGVIRGLA